MIKMTIQTRLSRQKAMAITEYSLLIAIVVAALLGMQFYLKRAVCGHWRESGDVFGFGRQYEYRVNQTDVSNNTINTTITTTVTTE